MAITLTIIGLGQIGASVGLGLQEHTALLTRRGYDREREICQKAAQNGALDKAYSDPEQAVSAADLVLLALPVDQIRPALERIASHLKAGAVVMDTAPAKGAIARWAAELLPQGCEYIGLLPVLNPTYLYTVDSGLEAAHADLFVNTPMLIAAPPGVSSTAVRHAADLTRLLGAAPLFAEVAEMDSLMASTHILPQLMAAALINATTDQPGWQEGRKLAGRSYAEATAPLSLIGSPQALSRAAALNAEDTLRAIDTLIASLQRIRSDIASQDHDTLRERLERARSGHERWWQGRQSADWNTEISKPTELPERPNFFGSLMGSRKPKNPKTS